MNVTRRDFLRCAGAGAAGGLLSTQAASAQETGAKVRLSACDWSLQAGGPEGIDIAKRVGLDGLEISAGKTGDKTKVTDPELRKKYKEAMERTGIVASSVAMGFLNNAPFVTETDSVAWVEQAVEATKDLGANVILLAFFGKGDLRYRDVPKPDDVDATVEKLKEAAPAAEKAGIILGLENTLSAKDNLGIIERVKSDAVRVYYDIRNSTGNGYDVPAEIRILGDRMCQIHFKDGPDYLGEGAVKMEPVKESLRAINYDGWIVLETSIPSKNRDADFKRNIAYVRELMGTA
jgi:L-ribulose-5-phosphate 3-epimerase